MFLTDGKGKRTAVVLPIREYESLLEDLADLRVIERRRGEKSVPWETVKRRLKRNGRL
jgi:hypothetical protein